MATSVFTHLELQAQQKATTMRSITIASDISCPTCNIVMEPVTSLDRNAIDHKMLLVARSESGNVYYVDGGILKMFAKDGRFLRQIGRIGGGPGEYQLIRNVLVSRDGLLHILDSGLARHSVFDESGKYLRSVPFPVPVSDLGLPAVLRPDGSVVVNAVLSRASDAGFALMQLTESGVRTAVFDEGLFDVRNSWLQWRHLWSRTNGELLVARPWNFAITVYDRELRVLGSVSRVADWLTPVEKTDEWPSDGVWDKPAAPQLRGIWEDADGHLWLYLTVPSALWKRGPAMVRGQVVDPAIVERPKIESVLEVLDLKTGSVLARLRKEGYIGLPLGAGFVGSYKEDSDGNPKVTISRVYLSKAKEEKSR